MDSNEAVSTLLIVVIVLLYYLYRIKRKKLHEEEQKYIETFLIRDKDISGMRVGSPFKKSPVSPTKINKIRHQDSLLKGPESPLTSRGNLKSVGKSSPARKTSGPIQGKVSPKVGKKFQFAEEVENYPSPSGKMEYFSPKRGPKDTMYNLESIRLQRIQEDSLKPKPEPTVTNLASTPTQSVPKSNLNATFKAMHDTNPPSPGFEKKAIPEEENLKVKEIPLKKDHQAGKREICFRDSDSESDHEQVKIIHDSSFEEEPQNQEETRIDAQKKQLPGKSTLNLEYLEDLGSGMGLKKYIAKKTVQEYIPNTDHGSKTISQLLSSQKNVTSKSATTSQTAQAAKPQGSMFSSNTSTTTAASSTGTSTAGTAGGTANATTASKPQGGLFAGSASGSTTQSQTTNTAATANKPQGGLFGNPTGTGTQGAAPAATTGTTGGIFGTKAPTATTTPTTAGAANSTTGTTGGLFGTKAPTATTTPNNTTTTTTTATTPTTTANKPQGGLFGNPAKPSGTTAGTAPLQVQTTGLLAPKTQSPDNTTPLFPKGGSQPQQAAPSKMRERSAAGEDLADPTAQKKMNIGK